MKTMSLLLALALFSRPVAFLTHEALDNTPENRRLQAERYLRVNSPRDIFNNIAKQIRPMLPEAEQQTFMNMLNKYLDMEAVNDKMRTELMNHFTAEEIAVLADFYSLPAAKSAMSKMNVYMSDIMPVVQAEIFKAQQKALRDQQAR